MFLEPKKLLGRKKILGSKIFMLRLYFHGDPKKLKNNAVYRHMCKGCKRIFHKSQGLEWHVMDEHPHLIEEVRRDLEVIAANKRILPARRAAVYMGEKRLKSGVDFVNKHYNYKSTTPPLELRSRR